MDSFWNWGALHPEVAAIAAGSWKRKRPPYIRGTGYCVDALEAAFWSVGGAVDFRTAVLRAANFGGRRGHNCHDRRADRRSLLWRLRDTVVVDREGGES